MEEAVNRWTGKLDQWLIAETPDIVLLHIGTNDISGNNEDIWNEVEDILVTIDDYEIRYRKCRMGRSVPYHRSGLRSLYINLVQNHPKQPPLIMMSETSYLTPGKPVATKSYLVDMQNGAGIDYRPIDHRR